MQHLLNNAIQHNRPLRTVDGQKVYILADCRQLAEPYRWGFHFIGGYIVQGVFYECRWNSEGYSDRTNHLGNIAGLWQAEEAK